MIVSESTPFCTRPRSTICAQLAVAPRGPGRLREAFETGGSGHFPARQPAAAYIFSTTRFATMSYSANWPSLRWSLSSSPASLSQYSIRSSADLWVELGRLFAVDVGGVDGTEQREGDRGGGGEPGARLHGMFGSAFL